MAIYKFSITWEDNPEVERTILIKSNQTFLEFYNLITQSFELTIPQASASFFTSDDYWDKHAEITLKSEDIQSDEKLMSATKIASFVEHTRQRFIFVYDAQLLLTFYIELIKILPDDHNECYPKIILSKGNIPKRRKKLPNNTSSIRRNNIENTTHLSDEEIDQMIYNSMLNTNISEEDILNGKIEDMLQSIPNKKQYDADSLDDEDIEMDDEYEEFFDEDDEVIDDEEWNNNGYSDSHYNDEN